MSLNFFLYRQGIFGYFSVGPKEPIRNETKNWPQPPMHCCEFFFRFFAFVSPLFYPSYFKMIVFSCFFFGWTFFFPSKSRSSFPSPFGSLFKYDLSPA